MSSEAYTRSVDLLRKASTGRGFIAAVNGKDNYKRIWTRDSALCGLAALATGEKDLVNTFRLSIESIFEQQHATGFIPSNVAEDGTASFGAVVGRVDNHAWIVISACNYASVTNDLAWLEQYKAAIQKCLALMNAWEFNGKGLIYVPQSADWADEYYHHGYILYDQLLRLWSLRCAARMFNDEELKIEAIRIQTAIETYFTDPSLYAVQMERLTKEPLPYWVMGFNPSAIYSQFDLQANALALLLYKGAGARLDGILTFINQLLEDHPAMLPSFFPAIEGSDQFMTELKNNYAFRFRNHPHEFHNGGLWPVWNGLMAFSVAPYDKLMQEKLLQYITASCSLNDWEFNECYQGRKGKPIGIPHCAWSAAGLIFASNPAFIKSLIV